MPLPACTVLARSPRWLELDIGHPSGDFLGRVLGRVVHRSGLRGLATTARGGDRGVLRAEEDVCQVLAEGQVVSVRYASQFPRPRTERVSRSFGSRR